MKFQQALLPSSRFSIIKSSLNLGFFLGFFYLGLD